MLLTPGIRKRFSEDDALFFTSDTHFFHDKIMGFSNRYHESVEEMNECIVNAWNYTVPKDGFVFHLGDVSFGTTEQTQEVLSRLNGRICLVAGNHDGKRLTRDLLPSFSEGITAYHEISVGTQKIVMCHFPMRSWNGMHHGSWNLHGHCHGNLEPQGKQLDVGVDYVGYAPISYLEVKDLLRVEDIEVVDHHTPKEK